jgi:hypothetical protein
MARIVLARQRSCRDPSTSARAPTPRSRARRRVWIVRTRARMLTHTCAHACTGHPRTESHVCARVNEDAARRTNVRRARRCCMHARAVMGTSSSSAGRQCVFPHTHSRTPPPLPLPRSLAPSLPPSLAPLLARARGDCTPAHAADRLPGESD